MVALASLVETCYGAKGLIFFLKSRSQFSRTLEFEFLPYFLFVYILFVDFWASFTKKIILP